MKKHIQIKYSYTVWKPSTMKVLIGGKYSREYGDYSNPKIKNLLPLIIEWWLHNIAYWITLPFLAVPSLNRINLRAKHVDLMIEVTNDKN